MWEKYWRCKNSNGESNEGQDRPMLVKEKTRCVEKDEGDKKSRIVINIKSRIVVLISKIGNVMWQEKKKNKES